MNSLEALDKLCDLATQDSDCLNYVIGLGMSIKQDLEHKEQLEKRNKELVNIIDELREENFKIKQIQTCIWGEQDAVRQNQIETLIKENQELKDKNTKMFVELSNTVNVLNKFFEYLDKDKTKLIAKYSLKETLCKIVDKVVEVNE